MAFDPPEGILDIGNATLRVGKLEVAETSGLNQGLQNIVKNDLLITENNESSPYTTNQKWGIKLPTTWVAEFEVKGQSGKYIDFNFYNENSASNALGYNLTFMDTTMTLRYDGGSALGGGAATIPTIVGAYRKVNIFFERGVISVSIDGTRYLYHKETDGFNQGLGVASRVVSATGSAFVNLFVEANSDASIVAFKNLRIVNGRFISDKTSNIAFIGGNLGVGVNSPQETLDIRGNMHFNRVSNVSSVSVDSNVVTEYTGPHDRPLRKYPEVAMTADDNSSTSGYVASTTNVDNSSTRFAFSAFIDSFDRWQTGGGRYVSGGIHAAGETFNDIDGNPHLGDWIQLQLPTKINLSRVDFWHHHTAPLWQPQSYVILGSNDGSSWKLIYTQTNSPIGERVTEHLTTTGYFKYFRLVVKSLHGHTDLIIRHIQYYGHEEGSGSLDTTLKSVYNVPATTGTQLEVYYDAKDLTTMPATVSDLSPNSNGGSVSGDPQVSNGAFVFDGVGDAIVSSGTSTSLDGNAIFSISLWSKTNTVSSGSNALFMLGYSSTNKSTGVRIHASTGNYRFFTTGGAAKTSPTTALLNEWTHITLVHEGTSGYKFYVNGVFTDEITVDNDLSLDSNPRVAIGNYIDAAGVVTGTASYDGSIANFRLYSKVLNADQVKELYDYQKDYFLGSKSQVTLYKGHLGVGVTEPSGQLELAGDERIQEYPPGPMSNYETLIPGHGVFCASASSVNNNYPPWVVFDDKTAFPSNYISPGSLYTTSTTGGISNGGAITEVDGANQSGEWVQIEFPFKVNVKCVAIKPPRSQDADRAPQDGFIVGSNDGNTWTSLLAWNGITNWGTDETVAKNLVMTKNGFYRYFRLIVTRLQPNNTNAQAHITEIQYFGTPGPTTLDKGSLSLTRSLDVPRISRYDVDTETPKTQYLICDLDTSVEPFNEQFINDISGAGHDMLFFANAADYNGYDSAHKALYFDGDVYGRVVYLRELGGNAEWTQSMWFKTEEFRTSPAYNVLSFFGTKSTGLGHIWSYRNDQMWQDHYGKGVYFNYTFEENKWYHAVSVYHGNTSTDPNVRSSMYINGVKQTLIAQGLTSDPQNLPAPTSLELADYINGSNLRHKGWISNYKMYSKALDASDALKLYKLGRFKGTLSIPETNVLIGSGKHSSIQQSANGPNAHLDVHGHAMISGELQAMSGNFHNLLGFARGGGETNSDRWRTDNCLACLAGQSVSGSESGLNIGILIRRSGTYMPFYLDIKHTGVNSSNSSRFSRNYEIDGAINGTSISSNAPSGVTLSVGNRGDDTVCFNVFVNREGRSYGVTMIRFAYYYGIKGREY